MNHEVIGLKKLLKQDGSLFEPGWAKQLVFDYNCCDIKASRLRVKEWDYYIILSDDNFGLALCYADNRYMGLITATFFDFNNLKQYDFLVPKLFPMGNMNVPSDSSKGDIKYSGRTCDFQYVLENGGRHLKCNYKRSSIHSGFEADVFLTQPPMDTMVIATPWKEDKKAFYYNQKINCMAASGYVKFEDKTYYFNPQKDFGTLDWGRGVWTYDNTWYWSSGNGMINGKLFGFNLGYGFGDTSAASENMIFYEGKCNKLDRILFEIPEDNIMKSWKFVSNDGRFDMDFVPVYDNRTHINLGVISQNAHQVFGKMSGVAILDNGMSLEVKNLFAFAERVRNRY